MIGGMSLPPQLEQFIREQVASGQFRSEDDVIRAALRLLKEAAPANKSVGPQLNENAVGMTRQSERPAPTGRWETPSEWRASPPVQEASPAPNRKSPRGLLADLRSGISFDDIRDARREMWADLGHGGGTG